MLKTKYIILIFILTVIEYVIVSRFFIDVKKRTKQQEEVNNLFLPSPLNNYNSINH